MSSEDSKPSNLKTVLVRGFGAYAKTGEMIVTRLPIVGSKHRGIESTYPLGNVEVMAELDNEYDHNAVAIYDGDVHIGYLPREKTHYFRDYQYQQTADWENFPKLISTDDDWALYCVHGFKSTN